MTKRPFLSTFLKKGPEKTFTRTLI